MGYAIKTSHNLQLYLCGRMVLEFCTGISRAQQTTYPQPLVANPGALIRVMGRMGNWGLRKNEKTVEELGCQSWGEEPRSFDF